MLELLEKLGLHGHRTEKYVTVSRNADRREGIEGWRSGAREARCTCSDVEEAQRLGALKMRRSRRDMQVLFVVVGILAFVPHGSWGKTLAVCVTCGFRKCVAW